MTDDGIVVTARHIIRATEAWTARLPGHRRTVAPVYSLMVATAPLPQSLWDEIGLADAETFSEHRHVIVYGQRSMDDRLVFGGRGAPYHFGSGIKAEFDADATVFANLRRSLTNLLPATEGVEFTHAWGGPLGIARDWHPGVGYDPSTGMGHAGGYVGDGVALSNLAGRTLADLVTTRDTALTRLPWVQHRSRKWEPEPLRWLGVNAGLKLANLADHEERLTGRPALLGAALSALTSHPLGPPTGIGPLRPPKKSPGRAGGGRWRRDPPQRRTLSARTCPSATGHQIGGLDYDEDPRDGAASMAGHQKRAPIWTRPVAEWGHRDQPSDRIRRRRTCWARRPGTTNRGGLRVGGHVLEVGARQVGAWGSRTDAARVVQGR